MTVPNSVVNRCVHVAEFSWLGGGDAAGCAGGDAGDTGCAGGGEDVGNGCDVSSVHAVGSPPEHKQVRVSLR